MEYKDILKRFSSSIFKLNKKNHKDLIGIITPESLININIYQRNLFGGLFKSFSIDFTVTKTYVGENNFRFLVKEYILKKDLVSPNILEASSGFIKFLQEAFFHS